MGWRLGLFLELNSVILGNAMKLLGYNTTILILKVYSMILHKSGIQS
jgi:hypothetical protein